MTSETKLATVREAWLQVMPGPAPEDAVAAIVSSGAVVKTAHPDPGEARRLLQKQMACCFICLPCFILGGVPCYVCCGSNEPYKRYANARGYTLTEKGIIYHMDAGAPKVPDFSCCYSTGVFGKGIDMYVLLDEDFTFEEEFVSECGISARTVRLSVNGVTVTTVDFLEDTPGFVAAVATQASKANLRDVDQTSRAIHKAVMEYYQFVSGEPLPTRVVGSGSKTSMEIDKNQMRVQARMFYERIQDKIDRARAPAHMEMVRDGPSGVPHSMVVRTRAACDQVLKRTGKRYCVFISYHQAESAAANAIVEFLTACGVPESALFYDKMSLMDIRSLGDAVRDTVVLMQLQSSEIYYRPFTLIEAYEAMTNHVPILPVALDSYHYATAAEFLNSPDFSVALDTRNPGASSVLANAGKDTFAIGKVLGAEFPNLRSFEYSASKTKAVRDAQLNDILNVLVARLEGAGR